MSKKSLKIKKGDKVDEVEKGDKTEKEDKGVKGGDQSDKGDKVDKGDKKGKVKKGDKRGKVDKGDKNGKIDKGDKKGKADNRDKVNKEEKVDEGDKGGKSLKSSEIDAKSESEVKKENSEKCFELEMNIFNYIKGNVFESEVVNYLRSKLGILEGRNKELPNVFYAIKDDKGEFFYNEFDSIICA